MPNLPQLSWWKYPSEVARSCRALPNPSLPNLPDLTAPTHCQTDLSNPAEPIPCPHLLSVTHHRPPYLPHPDRPSQGNPIRTCHTSAILATPSRAGPSPALAAKPCRCLPRLRFTRQAPPVLPMHAVSAPTHTCHALPLPCLHHHNGTNHDCPCKTHRAQGCRSIAAAPVHDVA